MKVEVGKCQDEALQWVAPSGPVTPLEAWMMVTVQTICGHPSVQILTDHLHFKSKQTILMHS